MLPLSAREFFSKSPGFSRIDFRWPNVYKWLSAEKDRRQARMSCQRHETQCLPLPCEAGLRAADTAGNGICMDKSFVS